MAQNDRGFAKVKKEDPAKMKDIASEGGQSQGQGNNPANFANDREKAQRAGEHSNGGGNNS